MRPSSSIYKRVTLQEDRLKERHWIPDRRSGSYDLEALHFVLFVESTSFRTFLRSIGIAQIGMLRLQGLGSNTEMGVPYTEDEIMAIVGWARAGGNSVWSDDKFSQMLTQIESQPEIGGGSGSGGPEDDEQGHDEDDGEDGKDEDDS
ncbi:hypothetical protein Tco_0683183 [Tanacetum coccineum]|uniref:Uncharacterized protein n=1 Tax=Tanacetum coccineum TaxID=301880 RepID=A0ABQ4XUQ5_9ASTR